MSTNMQRIAVFNDTMEWFDNNKALSDSIDEAKKNTTIFWEDDYPKFDQNIIYNTQVNVSRNRSFHAARVLTNRGDYKKIVVMNFANAFHPGGGVKKGSSAQEESLCRISTLYPLLYRKSLRDTFYKHHYDLNTAKASDALIYTEGVVVCKSDEDYPKRLQEGDWIKIDVITMAAPDLRTRSNAHAELVGGGAFMNDAELFGYHVKRAIHMLTCAASKGADCLVLGAFGCGAFQNDPRIVAKAYKTAIEEFPKVFKCIEFAVYCGSGDTENYEVFKEAFM